MWSRSDPFAIVLCTCDGAAHLDAQLRTLRQQAGVAEIVVNDDASSDGTMAILERHAAEDPRLRIERNERRLGVSANFERAAGRVRSPWIALSDQDDLWLSDKLVRMRTAWDGRACLMHHATHKFRRVAPAALPSPAKERRKFSGRDLRRLLFRNSVVGHTTLIRTGVVRRLMPFPAGVPHDWWIGVGAARFGGVQYHDEYLVHYRIHENNAFHSTGSRWRRLRGEHVLRLQLLAAVVRQLALREAERHFVARYLRLLHQAEASWFCRPLWRFYRQHAAILFGGEAGASGFRHLRKSLFATLGSASQAGRRVQREVRNDASGRAADVPSAG